MIKLFENPDVLSLKINPEITISILGNNTTKSLKKKKSRFIRGQYSLFYEFLGTKFADYEIKIANEKELVS
jgi:hypothetical protein